CKCEFRIGLMQMVHRMRAEIVERNDSSDDGSESGRNSRITYVANNLFAFDIKVMNLRLEGPSHLDGGAGEVDEHAAGINHVYVEAVGFQPGCDSVKVGLRQSKAFAEFLRGQPVMEVWRILGMELVDELLKGHFLLRGALQLEQQVLHREIVGHGAAIICEPR